MTSRHPDRAGQRSPSLSGKACIYPDLNVRAVISAVDQLVAEGPDVVWVPYAVGGGAHAGRTETSLLLHLAPDLVRGEDAEVGDTRPLAELLPDLVVHGVRRVSPNGVLGDPTGATATEGALLFEQMVQAARHGL